MKDDGNAAPAVAGGRGYIVDHEGTQDIVRALDATTGAQAWQFAYEDVKKNQYGFTVCTPLIEGDKIIGSMGWFIRDQRRWNRSWRRASNMWLTVSTQAL